MRWKVSLSRVYRVRDIGYQMWPYPVAAAIVISGSVAISVANAAAAPAAAPSSTSTSSNLAHTIIHLYDTVSGYTDAAAVAPDATPLCSAPGTQLKVGDDDGTTLTVSVDNKRKGSDAACSTYVTPHHQYKIAKSTVLAASPTIQGFVSGVLAVPFKFHVSDHSTTAGSTLGGYVGYRTSIANQFSVTPVIAGGLALISTAAAQASTSTNPTTTPSSTTNSQTSTGFSIAGGLIGSLTSAAASGAQFGILFGTDWLSKSANYTYNGKLWVAFEVGYNFAL